VPRFANAPEREIVDATREIASLTVSRAVPDDLLPKGRQFIRDSYGDRALRLGWKAFPSESEDNRLLRQSLVPFVAREGRMTPLIDQAGQLARAWLKDHSAVDAEMVGSVLYTAAMGGDRAFFDALVGALPSEKDHKSRQAIFNALGCFENPDLARAGMQLFLSGDYDAREAFYPLLFGPLKYRETATLPFEFVKANLDAILARLPREVGEDFAAALPSLGGGFCSASGKSQVDQFFHDRVKEYTGGPRRLAQVLETIELCTARSSTLGPGVAEFLRSR
jgi:alanyl aminopeptidase